MTQAQFDHAVREDARRWMTNEEVVADIERAFKDMAREYAKQSVHLQNWTGNGNKLPSVYV